MNKDMSNLSNLTKVRSNQSKFRSLDDRFDLDNFLFDLAKEYVEFFQKYGFVVVDNVLDEDQVKQTVAEMWDCLERIPVLPDLSLK